jgi:ABC-type dipeptide/oligopeptide/nickel transport system ATPase subunit
MQRISKLTLKNFKFFYGEVTIPFDRKNILLYGENGSGKSAIYWALYTFLQSSFKSTDLQIAKYFDENSDENLINRFAATGEESLIEVTFEDDHQSTSSRRISKTVFSARTDTLVKEAAQASDFMTYKLLSRLYDFKNSQRIDLFPIFADEILQFVTFRKPLIKADGSAGTPNAYNWWKYMEPGIEPRPKMHEASYKNFQAAVTDFNEEFEYYLDSITAGVNEYLNKFEQPIRLAFEYSSVQYDPFEPGSTTKRIHKTFPPQVWLRVDWNHDKLDDERKRLDRPHIFLNEAKLTTIALAIRFAVVDEKLSGSATAAPPPKLLVLDDLLLSLDMSNREVVLDVALESFKDSQLVLMTHDRYFFEMAKHYVNDRFAEDWKCLEIYGCVKGGIPQPKINEAKSYLEKAERFLHENEYEIAANFLRKEAESFCEDFLPSYLRLRDDGTILDLNGMLLKAIAFAEESGLSKTLFQKLDRNRKFILNPSSHHSLTTPKYRREIEKCLETLRRLRKIQSRKVLEGNPLLIFELATPVGEKYKFEIVPSGDARLIKEPSKNPVLSKCHIEYRVFRNGKKISHECRRRESLKKMYESKYEQSDKTGPAEFSEGIKIKSTGAQLKSLLIA